MNMSPEAGSFSISDPSIEERESRQNDLTDPCPELLDEAFVEMCYQCLLQRAPDESGRQAHLKALARGVSRFDVIVSMITSPEYYNVLTKQMLGSTELPNLQQLRPQSYELASVNHSPDPNLVFRAASPADYDWLEAMIVEHGYYEKPGVWSFAVDQDKRVIAEIISHFAPSHSLELGCATGPVLKLLHEAGIHAEGVEVSHLALALAHPQIRKGIHFGDLLSLELEPHYDLIIGMDVFEHLNPNKISAYLRRCFDLLVDGGWLFANIPAFGRDSVFEEVFPIYLDRWKTEQSASGQFSLLPVDAAGWPLHGHLVWATTQWWQRSFKQAGFVRQTEVEQALHQVYDTFYLSSAPARRSLFVFSKNVSPYKVEVVCDSIGQNRSSVV